MNATVWVVCSYAVSHKVNSYMDFEVKYIFDRHAAGVSIGEEAS